MPRLDCEAKSREDGGEYAIIWAWFQFAGSALLAHMVVTRGPRAIVALTDVIVPVCGRVSPGARRLLFETWASRIGFSYLAAGYLLQALEYEGFLVLRVGGLWLFAGGTIALVLMGFILTRLMTHRQLPMLPVYRPPGSGEERVTGESPPSPALSP